MTDSLLQQGKVDGWWLNEEAHAALVKSPDLTVMYDVASTTVGYLGKAVVGSVTSGAVWQIRKFTFGSDGDVTTEWADGDSDFDNIWDNRASLSYS